MRWPSWFTQPSNRVPQVAQAPAGAPGNAAASVRPATILEYVSDLTSDTKKMLRFVFLVGSLLVVFTACIALVCFAIVAAARELKGIPVPTTVSVGVGGASALTVIATLVTRWVKSLVKGAGRTGSSEPPSGTGA